MNETINRDIQTRVKSTNGDSISTNDHSYKYTKQKQFSSLSIGCLNVCGLRTRLNYLDFRELVAKYDLFCVTESKLDCYDTVDMFGYTFLHQPRRQKFTQKSGGIGVFVKSSLSKFVSVVEHESDYIMWFKISKQYIQSDEDIFYGVVYVPPSEPRFRNTDEFKKFEIEILDTSFSHKYVYLLGDFNARTGCTDDFVTADDYLVSHFEYDGSLLIFYNRSTCLPEYDMVINRVNIDSVINNGGNLLLDMCKTSNLFILNGRCGQDRGVGSLTFKDISTIDYSLSSFEGLKFIGDFSVHPLDPIFTDGHCLLEKSYTFIIKQSKQLNTRNVPTFSNHKRQENKKLDFINNIDLTLVNQLHDDLRNAINQQSVNSNFINSISSGISNLFQDWASQTFKTNTFKGKHKTDKPWFGFKC